MMMKIMYTTLARRSRVILGRLPTVSASIPRTVVAATSTPTRFHSSQDVEVNRYQGEGNSTPASKVSTSSTSSITGTTAGNGSGIHGNAASPPHLKTKNDDKGVIKEACGDLQLDDDDSDIEEEEMFVEAYESFEFKEREWGGPRRGGRFPEPTRYGDWERNCRCSDF